MKDFFKNHDLIKISGILVIIAILLTWVIPSGYFSGSEMVVEDIKRLGLGDIMQYGLLGMYYFTVLVTFLFVLGGFYQTLSKSKGYTALVNSISNKVKNNKIVFTIVVAFIFAFGASVMNEYFPLLLLVPFVITILNRIKVDKISAFCATFGAILVGTLGSTYSSKVGGFINTTFGTKFETNLLAKIILFVIIFILFSIFTVLRIKNYNNSKFEEYDKFEISDTKKANSKTRIWPYALCLILIVLTTLLAYMPWSAWKISIFEDITKWVNELSLFNVPLISYIFSNFKSFGTWDLFTIQFVMLFATLLIHIFEKLSWDEIFEAYGEGFKKIGSVVVILLVVYLVLEFSVMFPVLPVAIDWIVSLSKEFNAFLVSIATFIASIFGVEMQYVTTLSGTYLAATFAKEKELIALITQTMYGFASFFVPSSAVLMMGLSYLNISYKDWIKYIWKFLIATLIVVVITITIVAL